jgi:elongation factor Ts
MSIDAKIVKNLRDKTGAGMLDCQKALEEASGDLEKAVEILRKKGEIKAAKKSAERTATEGLIHAYIHSNGKVGVLLQLNCESDFVARNQEFKELAHDLALQVAAMNPLYLKPEDVPAEELVKEKEIIREQLVREGKPENVIAKIMAGKLQKYYAENCLLKQLFIKDDQLIIEDIIKDKIAKIGEKIEVGRFIRFEI